ncbi:hypothetical protein N9N67_12210, partial [Bacteriovoracaceae bacterium]|nr:hypothetical protein [Bacteriovoracaceae bacterium]
WYQTTSAFYFMLDFGRTPYFKKYKASPADDSAKPGSEDFSNEICTEILDKISVALVPGNNFGYPNSARLTLALEPMTFKEGIHLLSQFLTNAL